MIKGIIKFFKGETSFRKPCKCGQQADGKCVVTVHVSRYGAISQKTEEIFQCGEFKKQQEACSRIFENQKNEE